MPHLRNAFFILILCFFIVPLKAQHEYFSIQTGVNTYKLKNYKEVDGITGKLGFGVRTRLHQYFSFEYNLIYLQDQHCTAESNLFTNIQTIIKIKSHILQNQFLMVLLIKSNLINVRGGIDLDITVNRNSKQSESMVYSNDCLYVGENTHRIFLISAQLGLAFNLNRFMIAVDFIKAVTPTYAPVSSGSKYNGDPVYKEMLSFTLGYLILPKS